jgi:hypothetical protein
LLESRLDARLDIRRIRPLEAAGAVLFVVQVVVVEGMKVETGALAVPVTSAGAPGLPEQLGPREFALVLRDMMASGSWNPEETGSSS